MAHNEYITQNQTMMGKLLTAMNYGKGYAAAVCSVNLINRWHVNRHDLSYYKISQVNESLEPSHGYL